MQTSSTLGKINDCLNTARKQFAVQVWGNRIKRIGSVNSLRLLAGVEATKLGFSRWTHLTGFFVLLTASEFSRQRRCWQNRGFFIQLISLCRIDLLEKPLTRCEHPIFPMRTLMHSRFEIANIKLDRSRCRRSGFFTSLQHFVPPSHKSEDFVMHKKWACFFSSS